MRVSASFLGLFSILLLSACSTAASYQTDCFQKHPDNFDLAVNCTKDALNNDARVNLPVNQSFIATLYPFMGVVAENVKNENISFVEGQLIIAEKINELTNQQIQKQQTQQLLNSMSRASSSPRPAPVIQDSNTFSSCHVVGKNVNCHHF